MPHKPHHQRQHASLSLSIPGLLEVSGWFPELDADAQARVLDEMREQPVAAGAALCRRGETPLHWYGTLEGLLKWSITSDDGRAARLARSDRTPRAIVEELYLLTYGRFPDAEERDLGESLFADSGADRRSAIEDLLWALLNSAEFVFKD
jgi:hypothetical protein